MGRDCRLFHRGRTAGVTGGVELHEAVRLVPRAVPASNRQKRCAPWLGRVLTADPAGDDSE
jgi:hypothetical protein